MKTVIYAFIVEDSALICKILSDILNQNLEINVIGTFVNKKDALEKVKRFKPDVVRDLNLIKYFVLSPDK